MTTFKDIDRYIEEYKNPTKLGERILESIDTKLYTKNPHVCAKKLDCLYNEAIKQKNSYLGIACLYKWLELTNFKDANALAALKNTNFYGIFSYKATSELQYELLIAWTTQVSDYSVGQLFNTISEYIDRPDTYLESLNRISNRQAKLSNFYIPDQEIQLKLINRLGSRILKSKSSTIVKDLTNIISNLDLAKSSPTETVKLLALSPCLGKRIITKIQKYYIPDNYPSILATAQTLGMVENPDYWVQNLSLVKQQRNIDNPAELSTFE